MADVTSGAQALKMMLVEDDKEARSMLLTILRAKFPLLDISTAVDGRDGVEKFQTLLPDIVLTDVNMPEMNGLDMAAVVRCIKPDIKIIVVTADTGKGAMERAIKDGLLIDHYVLKPVDFQELFHAVEKSIAELAPV